MPASRRRIAARNISLKLTYQTAGVNDVLERDRGMRILQRGIVEQRAVTGGENGGRRGKTVGEKSLDTRSPSNDKENVFGIQSAAVGSKEHTTSPKRSSVVAAAMLRSGTQHSRISN